MAKDYYDLLGVARNAGEKEIRAAFRKLARKYHPDVNPGQDATAERFKEINEANEVLSNPESRKLYDRYGGNWRQGQQLGGRGAPPGGGFQWQVGDLGGDLLGGLFGRGRGGGGGIFDTFFGGGTRTRQRTAVLEQTVEITLEEAFSGATRALQVTRQTVCTRCGGAGVVGAAACPECLGQGFSYQPVRGEVAIPPGVDNGSRVRVSPGGHQVVLVVQVDPHSKFQRKGTDLYTEVSVSLYDAILGAEVVVPTLTGQVALTLPPESQNGRVFRLGQQGMPKLGTPSERGTLYVTVKTELPTSLTDDERRLFEQLKGLRPGTGGQDGN